MHLRTIYSTSILHCATQSLHFPAYPCPVSQSHVLRVSVVQPWNLDDLPQGSRLRQLAEWLDGDPYGSLIVLDECHKVRF